MALKDYWGLLKSTGSEFVNDKVMRLAAALAYYTSLSLAPLLIIAIAVAALFFPQGAAENQLVRQIGDLVGRDGATMIQTMIDKSRVASAGIVATVLGLITLFLGATGVFAELQDSLNTIWEVQPKFGRGVWGVLRDRLLSFAMVLGIGFLLLVSLVITTALAALGNLLGDLLPWAALGQVLNFLISLGVYAVLFAMIFKFLPDVKIAWGDVWFGAASTALLFALGKYLIGLYLGTSSIGSTYGTAGSFVVLLIWIYYSGLILFFGAELTKVYANKLGSHIRPAANAEPITAEARAQQGLPPIKDTPRTDAAHAGNGHGPHEGQPEPQKAEAGKKV